MKKAGCEHLINKPNNTQVTERWLCMLDLNPQSRIDTMRVLHVDDEPECLTTSKLILTDLDSRFMIDFASSVAEAFEKLAAQKYDVVICDYDMPKKSGLDFLEELRKQRNDIPFVVFTGRGREEVAIKALNLGADGYFNKQGQPETVYGELAHAIIKAVKHRKAEGALVLANRRSDEILKRIPDEFYELDRDWNFIYVNRHVKIPDGMEPEDLIGQNVWKLFPKFRGTVYEENLNAVMDKRELRRFEVLNGYFDVYYTVTAFPSANGIAVLATDITERKKMEQALGESEARYRMLFEESIDAILVADSETGTIIDCNRAASEMVGLEKSELVGRHQRLIHPKGKSEGNFTRVFKRHRRDAGGQSESQVVTKDGQVKDISIKASIIDLGGKKVLQETFRDITARKSAEKALANKEDELQTIIDSSPVWIFYKDRENRFLRVNKALAEAMQLPKERLEGHSLFDFYPRRQGEGYWKDDNEVMASGKPKIGIVESVQSSKGLRWVQTDKIPYRDAEGNIMGVIGFAMDITERKNAEDALRVSEERFRLYVENSPTAVFVANPQGKYEYVNEAACKLLGYSAEEFVSMSISQVVFEQDLAPRMKAFEELKKTGKWKGELMLRHKSGAQVYVVLNSVGLPDGKLIAFCEDITERKKAEEALQRALKESESMAKFPLENSSPVLRVDGDGRFLFVNPASKVLKVEGLQVCGLSHKMWRVHVDEALASGKNVVFEEEHSSRVFQFSVVPVISEGYVNLYATDITERKKAEEELKDREQRLTSANEKLRVVGSLTRHDVRNKLSAINNIAYLLKKKYAADPETAKHVARIESAVAVADRLLEFGKLYERIGVEKTEIVNVEQCFNQAVALLPQIEKIRVINECSGLTVTADSLLRQVFYNLVDNSIKHGKMVTQIKLHCEEDDGGVRLVYEDDGAGISAADKVMLFTGGLTTSYGNGVGLPILAKILQVYGWTITEEGEPGKGARFVITISSAAKV